MLSMLRQLRPTNIPRIIKPFDVQVQVLQGGQAGQHRRKAACVATTAVVVVMFPVQMRKVAKPCKRSYQQSNLLALEEGRARWGRVAQDSAQVRATLGRARSVLTRAAPSPPRQGTDKPSQVMLFRLLKGCARSSGGWSGKGFALSSMFIDRMHGLAYIDASKELGPTVGKSFLTPTNIFVSTQNGWLGWAQQPFLNESNPGTGRSAPRTSRVYSFGNCPLESSRAII